MTTADARTRGDGRLEALPGLYRQPADVLTPGRHGGRVVSDNHPAPLPCLLDALALRHHRGIERVGGWACGHDWPGSTCGEPVRHKVTNQEGRLVPSLRRCPDHSQSSGKSRHNPGRQRDRAGLSPRLVLRAGRSATGTTAPVPPTTPMPTSTRKRSLCPGDDADAAGGLEYGVLDLVESAQAVAAAPTGSYVDRSRADRSSQESYDPQREGELWEAAERFTAAYAARGGHVLR